MLMYSMWENMRALLIPSEPMEFDSRVPVNAPANAEDWLNVPVIVDATTFPGVAETVVFAEQKTISRILNYRPLGARPVIGLWIKLQQTTPSWHLGGHQINSADDCCRAPALAHADPD